MQKSSQSSTLPLVIQEQIWIIWALSSDPRIEEKSSWNTCKHLKANADKLTSVNLKLINQIYGKCRCSKKSNYFNKKFQKKISSIFRLKDDVCMTLVHLLNTGNEPQTSQFTTLYTHPHVLNKHYLQTSKEAKIRNYMGYLRLSKILSQISHIKGKEKHHSRGSNSQR